MRRAKVFFKNEEAGLLTQQDDGVFVFEYTQSWILDNTKSAISLTFPKNKELFEADILFPFFYNMLPEGTNKQLVCQHQKIELDDYFGILLYTAKNDTIGAVKLQRVEIDA